MSICMSVISSAAFRLVAPLRIYDRGLRFDTHLRSLLLSPTFLCFNLYTRLLALSLLLFKSNRVLYLPAVSVVCYIYTTWRHLDHDENAALRVAIPPNLLSTPSVVRRQLELSLYTPNYRLSLLNASTTEQSDQDANGRMDGPPPYRPLRRACSLPLAPP